MGLIKAAAGAAGGMMADQWKEFFVCDAIDDDVLVVKGSKQASGRSSNTKGESNVISDGSAVSVADGQCMMIVEQGQVIELSAEPGIFIYKNDLSPSIFAGNLKDGLKGAAKDAWDRFKFGGGPGKRSESLLLQHQGTAWKQIRHGKSDPVQSHDRSFYKQIPGDLGPLQRRVFVQDRKSDALLYECLR